MEVVGTFALFGVILLITYFLTLLACGGLEEVITPKKSATPSNSSYETKYAEFIYWCTLNSGGEVRVPNWKSLGATEAELARNLLLIRDKNIKLVITSTGEVVLPQNAGENKPNL
jgi:hypothetical protein